MSTGFSTFPQIRQNAQTPKTTTTIYSVQTHPQTQYVVFTIRSKQRPPQALKSPSTANSTPLQQNATQSVLEAFTAEPIKQSRERKTPGRGLSTRAAESAALSHVPSPRTKQPFSCQPARPLKAARGGGPARKRGGTAKCSSGLNAPVTKAFLLGKTADRLSCPCAPFLTEKLPALPLEGYGELFRVSFSLCVLAIPRQ